MGGGEGRRSERETETSPGEQAALLSRPGLFAERMKAKKKIILRNYLAHFKGQELTYRIIPYSLSLPLSLFLPPSPSDT